ncbi:hypothetical protein V6N13_060747 [Hibiscus sabdariffa]
MDKSILKINCIVHISFLLCIVVGITLVSKSFKLGMAMGNETDRLALLALKDQLVGSSHAGTELPKCFDETATKKRNGLWKKSIVVIIISLSLASVSVAFIAILCCRKQPRKDMIPLSMQRESLFQVSYKELVEATNDSRLLEQINEQSSEGRGQNMLDCLVSFTNVGVACSVEVPVERMKIENVVTELHAIKARLLIWNSYKEPAD